MLLNIHMKNLAKTLKVFFSYFEKFCPYLFLVLVVFIFFWKVFLLGAVLVPADILVNGRYPVKNPITTDAVSFSYPMKYAAIQFMKKGIIPLWNPYILFGTPLLANFQSAAFSITNIFYFLTDFNSAWNLQIIYQHLFASIFMYILLRHWKISKIGSILGGVSFAFGGFNLIWSEWNSHALTASFIPLLIFFTDRFIKDRKVYDGIFISIILSLQIFSGYPQIVLYTIPAIFVFWLIQFKGFTKGFLATGFLLFLFVVLGIFIAAPQVFPAAELLRLSQRSYEEIPKEWVFLTARQVITFIAPDFFGNHATYNYWGDKNYTSNIGFVGVTSFSLGLLAITRLRKDRRIIFLIMLILVSLIFSFATSPSLFLWEKGLLGLKAGASYRILVLFSFAVSALCGFGYDFIGNLKREKWILVIPFCLLSVFWIYALRIQNVVTIRNMVLPSAIFIFILLILIKQKLKFLLLGFTIVELFYFGWKFTPFVPRQIVFPGNEITRYLKSVEGIFRVVGSESLPVDTNMVYGIDYASGYDAEYPLSTAIFLGVLNSGDPGAVPQDRYGLITNVDSKLLDLTNTRFVLNENNILKNKGCLPRYFVVEDWEIEKDREKIFKKILDPSFPIDRKVILEEEPHLGTGSRLLFISDTYFPGWTAFVDGVPAKIYKADFSFRAVNIPKGNHEVKFVYKPDSFSIGLKISICTLSTLIIFGLAGWLLKRHA